MPILYMLIIAVAKPDIISRLVKLWCQSRFADFPKMKNNIAPNDAMYPAESAIYIRKPALLLVFVNPIILSIRLMFIRM